MATRLTRLAGDERGDTSVAALILLVPVALGTVMLFSFWGRQSETSLAVTHAAETGARAASSARDPGAATEAAHRAVTVSLSAAGAVCAGGPAVTVGADVWKPGGVVTVTVGCLVGRADVAAIAAPARTITGVSKAVIDAYRGYNP
jgi:hypothetical protein